jgi:hypothetical protein
MSIIYEALKKIERKKGSDFNRSLYKRTGYSPRRVRKPRSNKVLFIVLLIAFLFAGGLFFILNATRSPATTAAIRGFPPSEPAPEPVLPQPAVAVKDQEPEAETVAEEKKQPERITDQQYVLEGIVYDEEDPAAIINGRIVGKEKRLGPFIVKNITKSSVELLDIETENVLTLDLPF